MIRKISAGLEDDLRISTPELRIETTVTSAYIALDDGTATTKRWGRRFKVLTFITLWWMSAICIIMVIKHAVTSGGTFPFPFAYTSIVQPVTGVVAWTASKTCLRSSRAQSRTPFRWDEVGIICIFGAIQGIEIGLTNAALKYLTIASRTMISSTNVLFMMATAWIWGLERLGYLRVLSASLLVMGGICQGLDHQQTGNKSRLLGIVMQLMSMALGTQRWALAQHVMQRLPPDSALGQLRKIQLLAYALPINGLILIIPACLVEPHAYSRDNLLQVELLLNMLVVACVLVVMLYAELHLVDYLSAVAFNVLATIHQVPIVLAGVLINHDRVGMMSACGFACCLAGAFVYASARYAEKAAKTAAANQPDEQ